MGLVIKATFDQGCGTSKRSDRTLWCAQEASTPASYLQFTARRNACDAASDLDDGRETAVDTHPDAGDVTGARREQKRRQVGELLGAVSYTHLRAHETVL